jgi:hypothetical protein
MLAFDASLLSDPTIVTAGVGAVGAVLGAGAKPLFGWLSSRRQQRIASEDAVRDDLMAMVRVQNEELGKLRSELATFQLLHLKAMAEWQDKYNLVYIELVEVKAILKAHDLDIRRPSV